MFFVVYQELAFAYVNYTYIYIDIDGFMCMFIYVYSSIGNTSLFLLFVINHRYR